MPGMKEYLLLGAVGALGVGLAVYNNTPQAAGAACATNVGLPVTGQSDFWGNRPQSDSQGCPPVAYRGFFTR